MSRIKTHLLPHFNERPAACAVDTLVIHSMYARSAARRTSPEACVRVLDECKVSAHYLIARDGAVWKLVEEHERAWHAGVSRLPFEDDARENVNDFSIGAELIESPGRSFTLKQYRALAALTKALAERFPISIVVGHEHIAPERKTDPGPLFDWYYFRALLGNRQAHFRFAPPCARIEN